MAFQGITATQGQTEQLYELEGSQIIGTKIKAPFSINLEVYVLPMDNVLANKVPTHYISSELLLNKIREPVL